MATNVTLKRVNNTSGATDDLHPTTDWTQIESKPSTFTPTSHTHSEYIAKAGDTATGNITFTGNIIADGDIKSNSPVNTSAPISVKSLSNGRAIHIEETGAGSESYQIGVDTAGNLNFMNSGSGTPNVRFMDDNSVVMTGSLTIEGETALHKGNYDDTFRFNDASDLAVGWYTIATNTGNRAIARFGLRDTDSSRHQSVIFYAAHHYGNDDSNTITVLHNSRFGTSPFRYIRIKEGGTYDGAALQIYIDNAQNNVRALLLGDNFQSSGWVLKDWIADATDPGDVDNWSSMTEKGKIDLDQIDQGGIATTGNIYAAGNITQGRVLTTNDEGSGNGIDADTIDGQHLDALVRKTGGNTISGNQNFYGTDTSGAYSNAPIEIREVNLVTTNQSSEAYAPELAFHWGGRSQTSIWLSAQGKLNLAGNQTGQLLTSDDENIFDTYRRDTIDSASEDFNDFTTSGTYAVNQWNASGDVVANGPTNTSAGDAYPWGMLRVTNYQSSTGTGNGYVVQEYIPHNGDVMFMRFQWNGTWTGWRNYWGNENDGSGSNLDADKLDGYHASSFLRSDGTDSASGNLTFGGQTTFNSKVTIDTGTSTDALVLKGTSPTISFSDDSSSADDFFLHANSNNFYILADRDGNDNVGAGYENPHPLQLEADTDIGYLFGERIVTSWTTYNNTTDVDTIKTSGMWRMGTNTNLPSTNYNYGQLFVSNGGDTTAQIAVAYHGGRMAFRGGSDSGGYADWKEVAVTTGATFTGDLRLQYAFPRIYLTDTDSNNDYSIINSNGRFDIYDDTAATRRLVINSSGQVGIGTESPSTKMHISESSTSTALTVQNASTNGTVVKLTSTGDNRNLYLQTDHIYSNGALYLGDNSYDTIIRGSVVKYDTPNLYLNNNNSPENTDISIYFGDDESDTAHRIYFDDSIQRFVFSNAVETVGSLITRHNLYLNYDRSPAGEDPKIYFGDDNSNSAHYISFDNSAQTFALTNRIVGTAGRLGAIEYNGSDVDKVNFALSGSTLTITTS